MTLALIIFASVALILFFVWIRRTGHFRFEDSDFATRLHAIDLEAFQNLLDRQEEEYLRENLPVSDFHVMQRERMKAALVYLRALSQNGALLLQLGQSAKTSSDPRVAEAGQHIVDNAVRLRLYTLRVRARLYVKIAFPTAKLEPARVVNEYQEARNWAALLGRLHHAGGSTITAKAL